MATPVVFRFYWPGSKHRLPLGQHKRTGGQTGDKGQTDGRMVGQPETDGSAGRPADGGLEYSMPARPDSNLNARVALTQ